MDPGSSPSERHVSGLSPRRAIVREVTPLRSWISVDINAILLCIVANKRRIPRFSAFSRLPATDRKAKLWCENSQRFDWMKGRHASLGIMATL